MKESLYLDLMKKTLTNWIYGEAEMEHIQPHGVLKGFLNRELAKRDIRLMKPAPFVKAAREKGLDWPATAHTMIGIKRLDNLQECIETILDDAIPGDLIETGVWRGGASIFMRAVLKAYQVRDRSVWVADSFEGLPKPNVEKYPDDKGDTHYTYDELKVSLDLVKGNFDRYGLLDDQVRFLKGWFKDTLPVAEINKLSLIRLDGDMYESTMDAIVNLYPKLSVGGYVIVDDYCLPACRKAIADYRSSFGIGEEIIDIDGTGAYWRRAQ